MDESAVTDETAAEVRVQIARTPAEIDLALRVRRQVFVEEQGISLEAEVDGRDSEAVHAVAWSGGDAVGAARLLTSGDEAILARIAVLPEHRGQGIASRMIAELERCARQRGATRAVLHPHDYLEDFYRELGYCVVPGPIEPLGQHRLICMAKALVESDG